MLYLFRKSQRWLLWLLLIVVVITFVFWGTKAPRTAGVSPTTKLSSYGDQKITVEDLQRAKGAARIHLTMYGYPQNELTDGLLTTQAVNHIVSYQRAKKAGVVVGDDMLKNAVQTMAPVGSPEAYQRFIASNFGINEPREFEEDIRQIIAISMNAGDTQTAFFETQNEKDLDYEASGVKADIRYVNFTFLAKLEEAGKLVTSNDVRAFYDEDPKIFAQPEKYRFLVANFKAETNGIEYAEEDLKDYFELYQGDYTKTNEFGETIDMEFEEARPKVLTAFLSERANENVQEKAYAFRDSVATKEEVSSEELENDFREAAKAQGVQIQDSLNLTKGGRPGMIPNGAQIAKLLEEEAVGTLDVYEAGEDFYQVYLLVSRSEAFEPEFEECEKEAREKCVKSKAYDLVKEQAAKFLETVKADPKNFEGIATNSNHRVSKTPQPVSPSQMIISRDIPSSESRKIFRYPANTPMQLNGSDNVYVAIVTEFIEADPAYDSDKLSDRLSQQRSALERELYFEGVDKEVDKILAELQGNIVKATENARQ